MLINFQNVEKIVFLNHELKKKLPELNHLFHNYALSQQSPDLRPMGQKTLIEFVNSVKENHINIMKEHFNEEVKVQKIDVDIATHYEFHIGEAEKTLNSMTILKDAFFAYREGDQLYISTWR